MAPRRRRQARPLAASVAFYRRNRPSRWQDGKNRDSSPTQSLQFGRRQKRSVPRSARRVPHNEKAVPRWDHRIPRGVDNQVRPPVDVTRAYSERLQLDGTDAQPAICCHNGVHRATLPNPVQARAMLPVYSPRSCASGTVNMTLGVVPFSSNRRACWAPGLLWQYWKHFLRRASTVQTHV